MDNWTNGWLPSIFQGTAVRSKEPRIPNLDAAPYLLSAEAVEEEVPPEELFDKLQPFKELVADGTTVSLICGQGTNTANQNPTPYSEWPDPASAPVTERLLPQKLQACHFAGGKNCFF